MYCAGCGHVVASGKVCPQCGGPLKPLGTPGEAAALYTYERTVRSLRRYWFLFACLNVALGVTGLFIVQMGWSHQAGPWEPWPHPVGVDAADCPGGAGRGSQPRIARS